MLYDLCKEFFVLKIYVCVHGRACLPFHINTCLVAHANDSINHLVALLLRKKWNALCQQLIAVLSSWSIRKLNG